MARIRRIEIRHFRGIENLDWCPEPGINCLIGRGDSGKSTILDAIDLCIGGRRTYQFTDADFHDLDVTAPISISVTLGELDDRHKNLEGYGLYLRGFDNNSGKVEDEPESEMETVLTARVEVLSDLEPSWFLYSERAEAQGARRALSWADRSALSPAWIGTRAEAHLGWRRGSVLNRLTGEELDASAALAKAAREARASFGDEVENQLGDALDAVAETARELGIPVGQEVKALLDAHSISFGGGTISLHDANGVPLRGLGAGSTRLLVAGLQRKVSDRSTIILIDELEHGLEPHRIVRFLGSLGSKEKEPPLQVFTTTHSPVVVRELAGEQLFVTCRGDTKHELLGVGTGDAIQGTVRAFAEAFLAASVLVCEGASEVGLVRGLDQYRTKVGRESISAQGMALVDSGGGNPDRALQRGKALRALRYRAGVLRDDDLSPTESLESEFKSDGGEVIAWRSGRALEDELFLSLGVEGVRKLLARAVALRGEGLVDEHIRSASEGAMDLESVQREIAGGTLVEESRRILGKAARSKKVGWFKSVTAMEGVAREIVGPSLGAADKKFAALVQKIFDWAANAKG